PRAPPDDDRCRESPGADADDAGEQHEELERRRRRQQRRHEDGDDAVPPQRCHRALDAVACEAFSDESFSAPPSDRVHHEAARERSRDGCHDEPRHRGWMTRDHDDEQEIGDAGQRKERGVEECDEEEPGATERQRERSDSADEFAQDASLVKSCVWFCTARILASYPRGPRHIVCKGYITVAASCRPPIIRHPMPTRAELQRVTRFRLREASVLYRRSAVRCRPSRSKGYGPLCRRDKSNARDDVMGPTVLVNTEIKAGQEVLTALEEEGLTIRTAFWGRMAETREWRLFLITPSGEVDGPRDVYARIQRILKKRGFNFLVTQFTVVGPNDPVAKEVRRALLPSERGSTSVLSVKDVSGDMIEDAYVYRSS